MCKGVKEMNPDEKNELIKQYNDLYMKYTNLYRGFNNKKQYDRFVGFRYPRYNKISKIVSFL
jgi:hypothetical protein